MKRLRHWLFNLAAFISLMLFIFAVAVAIRSFWTADTIAWVRPAATYFVGARQGFVELGWFTGPTPERIRGLVSRHDLVDPAARRTPMRFTYGYDAINGAGEAGCPWWFTAAVLAILPGVFWSRRRADRCRKHWLAESRCLVCGYDLRATPQRCPECGAIPNAIKLITSPRQN